MDGSSESSRSSSGFRNGFVDLDTYKLIKASYPVEMYYEGGPKFCYCNLMAPRWTSWTDDNPGRRFYGCPNFKDKSKYCKFWDWHDPSLCDRGKEILLELKAREKLLLNEARFWKRQAKILSNKAVDVVEAELIEENARLKIELKELKTKPKEWKTLRVITVAVVPLLVFILLWFAVQGFGNRMRGNTSQYYALE